VVDDMAKMIMRVADETRTRHVLGDPIYQADDLDVLLKLSAGVPSTAR
jgi:hypothetical protein